MDSPRERNIIVSLVGIPAECQRKGSGQTSGKRDEPAYLDASCSFTGSESIGGVSCGRVDGLTDPQVAQFAALAKKAGADIVVSREINRDRWEKFVFLVALSGATGATRHPLGPIAARGPVNHRARLRTRTPRRSDPLPYFFS